MENAIKHHLGKGIIEQTRLPGGYTFNTWLLTLDDSSKVIFRTQRDFVTGGGRQIVISDVLVQEKFFYDAVNKNLGRVCPQVYVVDGTREHYKNAFCVMEYMEGTPLNRCFADLGEREKRSALYKIGEMAARINSLEIDREHPYVANRPPWMEYISNRLRERLVPLEKSGVITAEEASTIVEAMRSKKAAKTHAFLHLDMRHGNMIYKNGEIFLLDAENCEFGDPLWELATIDVAGELAPELLDGYNAARGASIDLTDDLYDYYKMERQALVLHVYMNEVKGEEEAARHHLGKFMELKGRLLGE